MFIANYIDRVNVGFASAHMNADIGLSAATYGIGAGLFFVGYAPFEVPSNILMQRYGARDDAITCNTFIPNWRFDNKRSCLVR